MRVRVPAGAPQAAGAPGTVTYGLNVQAWCVFLLVMHHVPVERCADIIESMSGTRPSDGWVHALLERAAQHPVAVLQGIHQVAHPRGSDRQRPGRPPDRPARGRAPAARPRSAAAPRPSAPPAPPRRGRSPRHQATLQAVPNAQVQLSRTGNQQVNAPRYRLQPNRGPTQGAYYDGPRRTGSPDRQTYCSMPGMPNGEI